jgi:hypothetical protein
MTKKFIVHSDDALQRLRSFTRKAAKSKARFAWCSRRKRAYLKKTPLEKANVAAKRLERKVSYGAALQEARGVLIQQATLLREKFDTHSMEWYFEDILQRSHLGKGHRKINRWNIYLRAEVKRINDGDY